MRSVRSPLAKLPAAHGAHSLRPSASPRLPRLQRRALRRPPSKSRHVPFSRAAVLSDRLADIGGNGGGGNVPRDRPTAEDGGNFFERNVLVDVLAKGGVALSELPRDLQEALTTGLLSMKDVHQWLSISSMPLLGSICRAAPAVRDRVMGNPRFVMQLCVELALGLSAKTIAELKARGDKCLKEELPFFLSDLMLEAFADCALRHCMPPWAFFTSPPLELCLCLMKTGVYSVGQRLSTVLYRSCQFFLVGMITSAVGHSITKWAVENGPQDDVHLAPVLDNSLGFGTFMALSSNLRYQTVNGLEERLLDVLLPSAALNTVATFILRFSNCYGGSVQWVWFAKALGLQ